MLNLSKQERMRERYRQMKQGYRPALEIYRGLMDPLVSAETRLLDAGCGPGGLVKQHQGAAQLVAGTDRYASHFQEPAEIANLVESDIGVLPFASSSLDVITCSWVLEHLEAPEQVFSEFYRVLRPGGAFLFITPNKRNYTVWMRRLIPNSVSKPIVKAIYGRDEDFINPTFYRANSFKQIDGALAAAGFHCERFDHVSDPTYLAVNDLMFWLATTLEKAIDRFAPDTRVHLVGLYRKPGE
jgi:SAM-dependent methyltransferase